MSASGRIPDPSLTPNTLNPEEKCVEQIETLRWVTGRLPGVLIQPTPKRPKAANPTAVEAMAFPTPPLALKSKSNVIKESCGQDADGCPNIMKNACDRSAIARGLSHQPSHMPRPRVKVRSCRTARAVKSAAGCCAKKPRRYWVLIILSSDAPCGCETRLIAEPAPLGSSGD